MSNSSIPDYQQTFRISFAARLINKLREMGFISRRGINGVNGQKLATAIGVSLPMARRYINGQSIPENATLQKIANWLNVDPFWLLYGDDKENSSSLKKVIDKDLFRQIFEQMYSLLCNSNLNKEQYMSLVTACIEIYCNVSSMERNDSSKGTAVTLMVDFLKKNM